MAALLKIFQTVNVFSINLTTIWYKFISLKNFIKGKQVATLHIHHFQNTFDMTPILKRLTKQNYYKKCKYVAVLFKTFSTTNLF